MSASLAPGRHEANPALSNVRAHGNAEPSKATWQRLRLGPIRRQTKMIASGVSEGPLGAYCELIGPLIDRRGGRRVDKTAQRTQDVLSAVARSWGIGFTRDGESMVDRLAFGGRASRSVELPNLGFISRGGHKNHQEAPNNKSVACPAAQQSPLYKNRPKLLSLLLLRLLNCFSRSVSRRT